MTRKRLPQRPGAVPLDTEWQGKCRFHELPVEIYVQLVKLLSFPHKKSAARCHSVLCCVAEPGKTSPADLEVKGMQALPGCFWH